MKTLDEVIKKIEACIEADGHCPACPYEVSESCGDMDADALHYLREYREKHDDIFRMEEALGYCEIMDNPPLTWDELKAMEGKPVWLECKYFFCPQWVILTNVYDEKAMFIGDRIVDSELKEEMGDVWQAYRKERK